MSRPMLRQDEAADGFASDLAQMMEIEHRSERRGLVPHLYPRPRPDARDRLDALTARVRHDLEIMAVSEGPVGAATHPPPSGRHVYDVVIVGAGQCGLTAAYALIKERVTNILVLDRMPRGREGPWITYSRMWTLRSPKTRERPGAGDALPGAAQLVRGRVRRGRLGDGSASGPARPGKPTSTGTERPLPCRCATTPTSESSRTTRGSSASTSTGGDVVLGRKVILATGIEGIGDWWVPPFVEKKLPGSAWTKCTDDVDSLDWRGRSIAVLGAGATAWDRAADLLELGAKSVTIYMRRQQILTANAFRYLEKAGYLRHYLSMSDADKWRWMQTIFTFGQPPTQDGVDRCAEFDNFCIHPGATWRDVEMTDAGVKVFATDGSVEVFDHVFIGCGFSMDPARRPELAPLADNILKWSDVHTQPEGYRDDWLITYPYLARDLRFIERVPGRTPVLNDIFCFNYGATVTNAHSGASLSGIKYGIEPLIHGVTYDLWRDDEPEHFRITKAWSSLDTDPSALAAHRWRP